MHACMKLLLPHAPTLATSLTPTVLSMDSKLLTVLCREPRRLLERGICGKPPSLNLPESGKVRMDAVLQAAGQAPLRRTETLPIRKGETPSATHTPNMVMCKSFGMPEHQQTRLLTLLLRCCLAKPPHENAISVGVSLDQRKTKAQGEAHWLKLAQTGCKCGVRRPLRLPRRLDFGDRRNVSHTRTKVGRG